MKTAEPQYDFIEEEIKSIVKKIDSNKFFEIFSEINRKKIISMHVFFTTKINGALQFYLYARNNKGEREIILMPICSPCEFIIPKLEEEITKIVEKINQELNKTNSETLK